MEKHSGGGGGEISYHVIVCICVLHGTSCCDDYGMVIHKVSYTMVYRKISCDAHIICWVPGMHIYVETQSGMGGGDGVGVACLPAPRVAG